MPICLSCGHENAEDARFCGECGASLVSLGMPTAPRKDVGPLRTAVMVLGLITAALLLLGGCTGFVAGSFIEGVEDTFGDASNMEFSEQGSSTSTTETSTIEGVALAGAFSIVVSLMLFIAAGLAKAAPRVSLVLMVLIWPSVVGIVRTDATSLFATVYYLALLVVSICIVLLVVAWRREQANLRL